MRYHAMFGTAFAALALVTPTRAADKAAEAEKPKAAEDRPAEGRSTVRRIVQLKHPELAQTLADMAHAFGVNAHHSRELGVLVLVGSAPAVAAAEEAVAKYDTARPAKAMRVPEKNVEFTAYLVVARPDGDQPSLPAALAPVIDQLRSTFTYKRYELLDTVVLRVRTEGRIEGLLPPLPNAPARTSYSLHFDRVHVEPGDAGAASIVSVNKLLLKLEVPVPAVTPETGDKPGPGAFQYRVSSIETGLEIREGQKVVVGKTALDGASGNALLLVLTVKVID